MRLKPLLIPLALASCASLAAQSALAGPSGYPEAQPGIYAAGTVLVRVGAAFVDPDDKVISQTIPVLADDPFTEEVEEVPVDVGVKVDLDNDTTWYISGVWLPIEHWGLELYYADSADLDADLRTNAFANGAFFGVVSRGIGNFKTTVSSLYVNWYPMNPTCLIQPYVGLGVGYTNIENDFVRTVFDRRGVLHFGSDFSWTAQAGVDFNFGRDNRWLINLSAMYVDSSNDLNLGYDTEINVPGFVDPVFVPVRIRADDMDLNPWIYNLGVGYRFSF